MSSRGTLRRMLLPRFVAAVTTAGLAAVLLVACTGDPIPLPSPTTSTPTATAPEPSETAEPVDPNMFVPGGSASENLGYFTTTVQKLIDGGGASGGRSFIDALATAGFDKAAMEVSEDKTSINGPVDSVFFSVKIADECLIGQWGEGSFTPAVMAPYSTGNCLIGETVPITW